MSKRPDDDAKRDKVDGHVRQVLQLDPVAAAVDGGWEPTLL